MRNRFHGLLLILFLGLGTLIVLPTGAAEPADAKKIDKLIERLGGDDFNDREKATAELDTIGVPALRALRKATQNTDVEISKRAGDLVTKIEKRAETARLLAPKKVHLVYRDVPVAEALADFGKKSGYPITLLDPEKKVGDRKISLDTGDVTFWQAFEMFCKEAGLTEAEFAPAFGGPRPIVRPRPIRPIAVPAVPIQPAQPKPEKDRPQGAAFGAPRQVPNPPVPAPIQIIGAPGRVQVIGANVGFNGGAVGNQIVVTDGKPKALPTDASGAIRVRTMEKPEVFGPADDKLILLGLELTPEPKMHVQQILNVKVDKALDDKGQELVQSVVPANPNVPVPLPAARPVPAIGRGRLIFGFTNTTPVYLKKGEKPSKSLKEFSGVVSAQILAPATAAITADKIMDAAGKEFKGAEGGRIKILDVTKNENGQITVKFELEQPPNVVPANPFGPGALPGIQIIPNPVVLPPNVLPPALPPAKKENQAFRADPPKPAPPPAQVQVQIQIAPGGRGGFGGPVFLGNQSGISLEDEKGNAIPVVGSNIQVQGAAVVHNMVFQPAKDQKASKLVFSGSKSVAVDVPFRLKDVQLP